MRAMIMIAREEKILLSGWSPLHCIIGTRMLYKYTPLCRTRPKEKYKNKKKESEREEG